MEPALNIMMALSAAMDVTSVVAAARSVKVIISSS